MNVSWITASGLAVRTAVRKGDGIPLLIFNGIGASLELLQPFIDAIPDVEVVIFDVPGAGESPPPASPWLHRLTQPTLVLQGDDDPRVPRINGRSLAALISEADFVQVDCGHLLLLTRAADMGGLVGDFLASGSAGSA